MSVPRILIVDDEKAVRDLIAFGLSRQGFQVHHAADAKSAKLGIAELRPDLAIVDWILPDMSGLDLTRSIRRAPLLCALPIIMVTARTEEQDRIEGFEAGADDYITKPFSARELVSRIRAVLRRTRPAQDAADVIRAGDLVLEVTTQRVAVGDRTVQLSPLEYQLLWFFMAHQGRVHSRAELRDRVWGAQMNVEERSVDVQVLRLRRALAAVNCAALIQTVYGTGYRFSTRT